MQKGRFGFSVWLYPYLSLWALYLEMNMVPFLIAGFVIALEQDEWAIKQCLHTIMICAYYALYRFIMGLFLAIPVVGAAFIVIDFIVDVVFLIIVFVFGFGRLKKGEGITMFGMGTINRAYGYVQQYAPMQQEAPQQQYSAPQQQAYAAPQPAPQRPDSGVTPPAPPNGYIPPSPPAGYAPPVPPSPPSPPIAPPAPPPAPAPQHPDNMSAVPTHMAPPPPPPDF